MVFEYWLALLFLGQNIAFWQLIAVITAARITLLSPVPGALGVLEAGQALAMAALGYDPSLGISLSLLIRARDILFGLLGLGLGASYFRES
jgi:uncharacterized membrane protein YbhN (UPF0104 family)